MLQEVKMVVYRKKLAKYEGEEKDYEGNRVCEMKLMTLLDEPRMKEQPNNGNNNTTISTLSTSNEQRLTFDCISDMLTYDAVKQYKGKINTLKSDMKAFIRVCSQQLVQNGKITLYLIAKMNCCKDS